MTRKSLIALSICLVMAAGIAATVWAFSCCDNRCLCNGGKVRVPDSCMFVFFVDHDKDCGTGHDVFLYLKEWGDPGYTSFMMGASGPPWPACIPYSKLMTLNANTTYHYYFKCDDCEEITSVEYFNTGDCG